MLTNQANQCSFSVQFPGETPLDWPHSHAAFVEVPCTPFYIFAVASRMGDLIAAPGGFTVEDAERAFLLETLTRDGRIYNYCRYLYDISLSRGA